MLARPTTIRRLLLSQDGELQILRLFIVGFRAIPSEARRAVERQMERCATAFDSSGWRVFGL
jgi:hypothetical protein